MRQMIEHRLTSFRWVVTCVCLGLSGTLSGTSVAAAPEPAATAGEARPPRGAQGATLAGGTAARSRPAASTARGGTRGPCETSECFLELGAQQFADGHFKAAAENLRYGLSIFPPDGKPEVKKASEEVYAKAQRQIATVEVTVTPADAEVKIDGRAIAPNERAEVFVEAGEITLEAGAKGYEPFLQERNAMKGWTTYVRVVLKTAGRAEPAATVSEGPNKAVVVGGATLAGAVMILGGVRVGLAEDARSQLHQSGIALFLAGAALWGGTTVYGLWPRGDRSPAAAVLPVVGPETAGFVWSGAF